MKISSKLVILFTITVILVGVIPFYIHYNASINRIKKDLRTNMQGLASDSMNTIDHMLYERYLDIRMLSKDPIFTTGHASPEQIRKRLLVYKQAYPSYISISYFNMHRIRIADSEGEDVGIKHSFTEFWPEIAAGRNDVADLTYSETLNKVTVYFAAVVRNKEGKKIGVVATRMSPTSIGNILKAHAKEYGLTGQISQELVNRDGHALVLSRNAIDPLGQVSHEWAGIKKLIHKGENSGFIDPSVDDQFLVFARAQGHRGFKTTDWTLIIEMPESAALARVATYKRKTWLTLLAMGAFVLPLILLFSRAITRPIRKLGNAAAEIGKGNLEARVDIHSGDEIGELAMVFNGMAHALQEENNLRTQAELRLRASEERFRHLMVHAPVGIGITDMRGRFLQVNNALCNILGRQKEELESLVDSDITHPDDRETSELHLQPLVNGRDHEAKYEKRYLHKDGHIIWIQMNVTAERSATGDPVYFIGMFEDISDRKKSEERIWHQANYDTLTNLPNRLLFFDRLSKEITKARRTDTYVALIFMDLDGFKQVNDEHGHDAGDIVLKAVAHRWLITVREMDTLARIGGDEFAVVIGELESPNDVEAIAEKLIHALSPKIELPHSQECQIGASLGISAYPCNATEIDLLITAADQAMYESKRRGKNTYTVSNAIPSIEEGADNWLEFNNDSLVGVEEIDDQHRQLVHIINQVNKAIIHEHADEEIKKLLDELVEFTIRHFETEHQLMVQYDYPDRRSHDNAHEHLTRELRNLVATFHRGNELLALQKMKHWYTTHVRHSDKALGIYLSKLHT